jgi:hypothetical protein
MPIALLKRVEKFLEEARGAKDGDQVDALQDIVDAIRIVDAKLTAVQRDMKPAPTRRRLTKGPPEFREDRVDLPPKAKGK